MTKFYVSQDYNKLANIKLVMKFSEMPFWDKVLYGLCLIGFVLIYWEIQLYRWTIIDLRILISIFLIPGIILTPILYKILNSFDGIKAHWFWHYVLHTIIVGGIFMFAFVSLNYYGASKDTKIETFRIIEKGSLPGDNDHRERLPYANINYHGFEKQLVYSNQFEKQMDTSSNVILYIRKGLLGFAILEKYELKK